MHEVQFVCVFFILLGFTAIIDPVCALSASELITQGNELYSKGDYINALDSYNKSIDLDNRNYIAWYNRGNAYLALNNFENAYQSYLRTTELNPNNALAWNGIGNSLMNQGRYQDALKFYNQALSVAPNYTSAWYNKGVALAQLGRYEEALESFNKLLSIDPDNTLAWYNKGRTLYILGRYQESQEANNKALLIDPHNPKAQTLRNEILAKLNGTTTATYPIIYPTIYPTVEIPSFGYPPKGPGNQKLLMFLPPFLVVSLFVLVVYFASSRLKYSRTLTNQKPASEVYFSVICPKTVVPESSFLLDIWAHLEDQRNEVINQFKEGSVNDDILVKTKGPVKILEGIDLVISLDLPDLIIENSDQHVLWTGNISSVNFLIKIPKDVLKGEKIGTVKIYASGLLILNFFFEITISEKMTSKEPIHLDLHRISKAFVSYASLDREKVLARIQGIQKIAPHLEFKMDIKDIKSGQKWKKNIREFIETSDIFYLFWSKNAKDSLWVEKEWRCALQLKGIDFIDPVPLESPEEVPPPAELSEKHFNDWTLAYSRVRM